MKKIILKTINFYQLIISPMMKGNSFFLIPSQCRYPITCSEYFTIKINEKGVVKGILFGFWRLLHCNVGIKPIN